MGCGCSMHNKRVAAAQKEKDQTTSAGEVGDADQYTPPATVMKEQHASPGSAPPQNEKREFLQGMSPPSSPEGVVRKDSPVGLVSDNNPPLPVLSGTVALETGNALPAVLPATELGQGNGAVPRNDGSIVAVPLVAPSSGGRRTGGGGGLLEGGEGGEGARVTGRSVEQILQPRELQERPRRFSNQDPLPQIGPMPAASTDLASIQRRGPTLGPGLDVGFREEPTCIVPTAAAGSVFGGEGSGSSNGNDSGIRPIPGDQRHSERGVESVRHGDKGGQRNFGEVLVVTPVTPDDGLDEDVMSDRGAPAKDRWPRNDGGGNVTPVSGRGKHYDRMDDDDGTPPRHEARPALAAEGTEAVPQAANSSSLGGRGGLSALDFSGDGNNDQNVATGGVESSGDDGAWGATSGAYSLLDAEEEDFMETLLMES